MGNTLIVRDGTPELTDNNIIIAHHLGATGYVNSNLSWKAYYTFSRNYGNWRDQVIERLPSDDGTVRAILRDLKDLKKINHSLYLGSTYTVPRFDKLSIQAGVGIDAGELYGDTRIGVMTGCTYQIY